MNTTKKATGKLYHTLWQAVHQIPRWNIEKLANKYDIDARKFSQTSHVVMLLLGHLTHARCLTEICDNASVHWSKLHLVRRATPAPRNTFSHANRTRDAALAEELYWSTLDDMLETLFCLRASQAKGRRLPCEAAQPRDYGSGFDSDLARAELRRRFPV